MGNIILDNAPVFNDEMEALTTSTPAHADQFNARFAQILNNENALKQSANTLTDDKSGGQFKIGIEDGLVYIEDFQSEDESTGNETPEPEIT